MDKILERFEKGLCGICGKKLDENFKQVEWKNKKVWICAKHPNNVSQFLMDINK